MELQQLPELNDRQKEAMEILRNAPYGTTTILGYGGAVGGGKTYFIARAVMAIATSLPGGRILVARDEFNKLKTTTMEEFDKVVPEQMIVRRHDTDNWREIRLSHWPEGVVTKIYFRGLQDWVSLGSEQYSAVFIDEAGEVSKEAAQFLLGTRLRHQLPEIVREAFLKRDPEWKMRYYFVTASNPYPGWFTDWFYFRQLDDALEAAPGSKVHFVQSKMSDNAHNLPENYEAVARATLPPDRVQRFIEGRFDTYSDQVYGEVFNPDVHRWLGEVPEDEIDRVIGGLDFGGARPDAHFSAGLVGVVTKSNRLIRVAEFKSRGPGVQDRQMAWMLAMQTRWAPKGKRIHWVADKTQHFGVHMLRLHGFWVTLSSGKEDEMGINEVARRMMLDDSGLPGSYYLPELVEWEREIYQYRWDQSANDNAPAKRKPIKRNDDLMDADRYMHELLEPVAIDPMKLKNQLPVVA